jgi:hypothetical protein
VFVLKVARIAVVAVALAGVVIPTTSAGATKTICVGIVVDARPLGGPVSADCTTVSDGSTGYDVLRAAGHTVSFRQDGLICTIDKRPASGCAATDGQHFWAYFHRAPRSSSWSYSDEGATTYKPDNGATEGWVWRNNDSATPKDVPYSTICPQSASPTPSSTPQVPTPQVPTHAATASAVTATPSASSDPPSHRPRRKSATASPSAGPATSSRTPLAAVRIDRYTPSSPGPPWGLIAGAIAIAVLGGAAAWRWRRRGVE